MLLNVKLICSTKDNTYTACVALHNFIKTEEGILTPAERSYCPPGYGDTGGEPNGRWRDEQLSGALIDISKLSVAAHERLSKTMRDSLQDYVVNEGAVEWQEERVGLR